MKSIFEKTLKKLKEVKLDGQDSITKYVKEAFLNDLNAEMDKIPEENIIQTKKSLAEFYYKVYIIFKERPRFRNQVLVSFYKWLEKGDRFHDGEEFFLSAWMIYVIELVSRKETKLIEEIKSAILKEHLVHLIKARNSFVEAITIYDESEEIKNYILKFCKANISYYLKRNAILDFFLYRDDWQNFLFLFDIVTGNIEFVMAIVKFLEQKRDIKEEDKTDAIKRLLKYIRSSKFSEKQKERLNKEIAKSYNLALYLKISEELDSDEYDKERWSNKFKQNIIPRVGRSELLIKLFDDRKDITINDKDKEFKQINKEKDKEIVQIKKEKNKEIAELKDNLKIETNRMRELREKLAKGYVDDYKNKRLHITIEKETENVFHYVTQKMNKKIDLIIEKVWEIYQETKQLAWESNKREALERIKKNCNTIFNQFKVRELKEEKDSEQLYDPSKHEVVGESNKIKIVRIIKPLIARKYKDYNGRTVVIKKALVKKINKE